MEKGVNIHLPPVSANLKDDACGAMIGLLDVSVVSGNTARSSSYGASELIRTKCQEIVF